MKKLLRLLLILILPFFVFCFNVLPTYCLTQELFPSDNVYSITPFQSIDGKQNFYNYSNLQDVYYSNFLITIDWEYIASFYGDFSNSGLTLGSNKFNIDYDLYCFNIPIGHISYVLDIDCFDNFERATYYCRNFVYTMYENVKVNPLIFGLGGIVYEIIPSQYLNLGQNVTRIYWDVGEFSVKFDIVLNNQYFYNKYFGLVSTLKPFVSNNIANTSYLSTIKHRLTNTFYTQKNWGSSSLENLYLSDFIQSQNSNWVIFENDYSFNNDYVVSFQTQIYNTPTSLYFGNGLIFNNEYLEYNLILNYNYNNDKFLYLYSNTTNNDGLISSTIIPNGSNDLYKSCEWWDVATHIYNLFVYLIFDAPVLSSFTRLSFVIIQFIVSVFEWSIALFDGVSSTFFVSTFIGFIVLMFLLKIIFKG